jgi:hypothetical protein
MTMTSDVLQDALKAHEDAHHGSAGAVSVHPARRILAFEQEEAFHEYSI